MYGVHWGDKTAVYRDFLKTGVFNSVVTNAPFIGRVEKGVEMSVYITEFAVITILDTQPSEPALI